MSGRDVEPSYFHFYALFLVTCSLSGAHFSFNKTIKGLA